MAEIPSIPALAIVERHVRSHVEDTPTWPIKCNEKDVGHSVKVQYCEMILDELLFWWLVSDPTDECLFLRKQKFLQRQLLSERTTGIDAIMRQTSQLPSHLWQGSD